MWTTYRKQPQHTRIYGWRRWVLISNSQQFVILRELGVVSMGLRVQLFFPVLYHDTVMMN